MARGVNRCIFIGNLVADPDVRYTQDGTSVVNFTIACNEEWKDKDGQKKESVEFIRCVAWGKLGQICREYLVKGKLVYVAGKWTTRKWESEGKTNYMTECKLSEMQMLGSGGGGQRGSDAGGGDIPEGDIPF